MSDLPRIGWIIAGDMNLASSRLQGYRVKEYLAQSSFECEIAAANASSLPKGYSFRFFRLLTRILRRGYSGVIFQKPDWMMFKLSEILRLNGVRTAAVQCDPFPGDYDRYFDAVILTTERLRDNLNLPNAQVIDDMLEVPPSLCKGNYEPCAERLRLVWVGQGMPSFTQDFFQQLVSHPLIADAVEVVTIGRGDWVTRQWSLETVHDEILSCDIAIIPLPELEWASSKSTNRLTQFMALGMPTIASPIDSYKQIYLDGSTFLLANSIDEFAQSIRILQDSERRMKIGKAARAFAWENYSPAVIGPLWHKALSELLSTRDRIPNANYHTRLLGAVCGLWARLAGPSESV